MSSGDQQRFLQETIAEWVVYARKVISRNLELAGDHAPDIKDNINFDIQVAGDFANVQISFPDAGRFVDIKVKEWRKRPPIAPIQKWVKEHRKRIRKTPGYGEKANIPRSKKIARVASAILFAKTQKPTKRKKRWWNKSIFYLVEVLRGMLQRNQAAWMKAQLKSNLQNKS